MLKYISIDKIRYVELWPAVHEVRSAVSTKVINGMVDKPSRDMYNTRAIYETIVASLSHLYGHLQSGTNPIVSEF